MPLLVSSRNHSPCPSLLVPGLSVSVSVSDCACLYLCLRTYLCLYHACLYLFAPASSSAFIAPASTSAFFAPDSTSAFFAPTSVSAFFACVPISIPPAFTSVATTSAFFAPPLLNTQRKGNTLLMLDDQITKRFKEHDRSHFELKGKIKAKENY